MLMLLAVYGLRGGEVGRLRLENLDWEHELLTATLQDPAPADLPAVLLRGRGRPSVPPGGATCALGEKSS